MVLGDAICTAMRAGAALRATAASAAATAGRMEGISSGFGLRAGSWRGPTATWRPAGPIQLAAVRGRGVGLRFLPSGFGRAGLLQCGRACASACAGKNSSRGLHLGVGGPGSVVAGLCVGGVCGSPVGVGVGHGAPRGGCVWVAGCGGRRGSLGRRVCGGRVWVPRRGRRAPVAWPGAVRVGGRGWATGWGVGREGQEMWGWVCVRCVAVRVRLPRCVCVVSCRARGLE